MFVKPEVGLMLQANFFNITITKLLKHVKVLFGITSRSCVHILQLGDCGGKGVA